MLREMLIDGSEKWADKITKILLQEEFGIDKSRLLEMKVSIKRLCNAYISLLEAGQDRDVQTMVLAAFRHTFDRYEISSKYLYFAAGKAGFDMVSSEFNSTYEDIAFRVPDIDAIIKGTQ